MTETEVNYPMLPEDEGISADDDVAAAVASVLESVVPLPGEAPEAYGMTWDLDFVNGRMRRQGQEPAKVRGIASSFVWAEMALRTARYAHSAFSDDFGMEHPENILGHVDVGERVGDYEQRMREALIVHDRYVDVVEFDADYSPDSGTLTIHRFVIVTDDQQRVPFGPLRIETGA